MILHMGPFVSLILLVLVTSLQAQNVIQQSCGINDFRCSNGKCIEESRRCDRVNDCAFGEDEENCTCTEDEFQCKNDGSCIELRKQCDGTYHCIDRSDEENCPCGSNHWQCDHGSCIKLSKRCDGRVDCPTDRSDERNCVANGYFRCGNGKLISEYQRCNGQYDCDPGDYSDERNCPCGDGDFKCDNGYCIPASKKCDRTTNCQDASDERNCTYGTICMAYQYKCTSGQCVPADSRCNGTEECIDSSDETNCPCKRDEFRCRDGSCINMAKRCNGFNDCRPNGEDEFNCAPLSCPSDQMACDLSSSVRCAVRCDDIPECDNGEDEQDCEDCSHKCDGRCIDDSQICDNVKDCSDGSDEFECSICNSPEDFRCDNGDCINAVLRCNNITECADGSDEADCSILTPPPRCNVEQFQCLNGICINKEFACDGRIDCLDQSDEKDCWCNSDEWQCASGQCIPRQQLCDGYPQCTDRSDEQRCPQQTTQPPIYTTSNRYEPTVCNPDEWQCSNGECIPRERYCDSYEDCYDRSDESNCPLPQTTTIYPQPPPQPQTQPPVFTTTPSYPDYYPGCGRNEWRCENGPCIAAYRRCDGNVDCPRDGSDEFDCPPDSPVALNLKTYPTEQSVRFGGDAVFSCRDEGPIRAPVRWIRESGRPLKPWFTDKRGRLEMTNLTIGDSGAYICQAVGYLGSPGAEKRVELVVQPQTVVQPPPFTPCQRNEATCGNGQCIPKSAICDGRVDCSDNSDEENCHCEPNQFKCDNRKCIMKTWLCDSDDDCGDNSDEANCKEPPPGQQCRSNEFQCADGSQCVPKSFHCDGQSDCFDKSDELGCAPVHVVRPPYPSNLRLNPGDTLELRCEAVGVPTPLISWRLNWREVPEKCHSTSENGIGILTCPGMQPQDSGAYSCEALNNRVTVFAVPDAIVNVDREPTTCPAGYFNSEARSQNECIRCFCFGKTSDCRSADLYTYSMPTPLGEGGTRLVGVRQEYTGQVQLDKAQTIYNEYFYSPLRNGATVTKLASFSWSRGQDIHPYLTLPESYNGNRLTSYGGHIKYRLSPHNPPRSDNRENLPDIIIIGKYETLVHMSSNDRTRDTYIEARFTPDNWQRSLPEGLRPASREDIMMALDDVEVVLLRAGFNNAGVNISDFSMESARDVNAGLGIASLVEECSCPEGYKGLSCQECAAGYVREKSGPWLGSCVRRQPCPPLTYGDTNRGGECRPCPCPLTNRGNQFASSCHLDARGDVTCDCLPGYDGPDCSYCADNYYGNPLLPGDSCRRKPSDNCNPVGTSQVRQPDECVCKDNVQGRYCDQCKNGSFYLSNDFRHGCALCFCSGVVQECMVSDLRRKTTTVVFNVPQIVDQVRLYTSTPLTSAGAVRYAAPVETDFKPEVYRGEIVVNELDRSQPSIFYWSLPPSFSGDKVTSYGGYLNYVLDHVPTSGRSTDNAADVQLISENSLTFHYFGNAVPNGDGQLNASVQFLENKWQRPDGKQVSREHLLLALADVKTILVKASYSTNNEISPIIRASIETADAYGDGPIASHVEKCLCPVGYEGTSCEDCAPGYTRSSSGLYLELCGPCDCNGHSNMCHPETGVCYNCADNTDGPNCEVCKDGYERNAYNECTPRYSTARPPCSCDPRGIAAPCNNGYCYCKANVEGQDCDKCRPGTFGLDASNPEGCLPCYCSGVTNECYEANHYNRIRIPAPIFGPENGGYTLMDLNGARVINDQFVAAPNESELMYIFSDEPDEQLYWSLPLFPGNRVLSYGGTLSLTQKFQTGGYDEQSTPGTDVVLIGDTLSIYWTNPTPIVSNQDLSYQVPLSENGWFVLNTPQPVSRSEFMSVLKNIHRVLVRATLSPKIVSTAIADVSMDTAAAENYDSTSLAAKGVEVCMCPPGYAGTSCEKCSSGYYKDSDGYCKQCNCNGHDCQLGSYGAVVCNCRPPYTGSDCSIIGLVMELYPRIHESHPNSTVVEVTFTCKYKAPVPLTIKFYSLGREMEPAISYKESYYSTDGWSGEHAWTTLWDTRFEGEVYECHTITERGFTLGVLSTTLPETGDSVTTSTPRPSPPPQSTVIVEIIQPNIKIQEIGSSVNFTCQARSRMSPRRLRVNWSKSDGYLPQERSFTDANTGTLFITNLQISDSGVYICQTTDGITTDQAIATLKVPGNNMTLPIVSISPPINEYYEGDRIVLNCTASGNPAPRISWQRSSSRPLPRSFDTYDSLFILDSANVQDSGEYRCIATNTAGTSYSTAIISVRPRPSWPSRGKLTVSMPAPTVVEGQSLQIACTGTPDVPAGTIDWIRQDGVEFLSNIRVENGVLYIDYAVPGNQGVYECRANTYDVNPVSIIITVARTSTPSPDDATNITVSVDRLEIPTGGSGTIDCTPHGYPRPLIRWLKPQGEFGPGTSQRENTLVISNAQESDEGYYLCVGEVNGDRVVSTYVYVGIEKRELPHVDIYPQRENSATLGSTFDLYCRVSGGYPPPLVSWSRNGGRPLSARTQIQQDHTLRFQYVEVNDEGEYTCTATNEAGSASASAILKVRSQPEITIKPSSYIEPVLGDRLVVECRGDGYPAPEVSIQSMPDYRVLVPPTTRLAVLTIPSVTERDEGDYACVASSSAGTITEQFAIRVDYRGDGGFGSETGSGYDPGSNEIENYQASDRIVIEGKNNRISCDTSDEFEVIWTRADGRPLQNNARQQGSELIIYNTSKQDSGRYVCNKRNRQTQAVEQAVTVSLQVVTAPRITLRPPTQTVSPGQSPTVECMVEGDDILSITWRPVNRAQSRRVEIRNSTLIFHEIQYEDEGEYECVAYTRVANATDIAKVIVSDESDRVTSHDNEQFAPVGAAVHLSCNTTQRGYGIRWTKDGKPLPRTVRQKNDGSLYIRYAQKSDSGFYVCDIRDEYGRSTSNYINLHVEGDQVCLENEFPCANGHCISDDLTCDGINDCLDGSDERDCLRIKRYPGSPDEAESLVYVDQPRRSFRVGENVEVLCRSRSRDVRVSWERYRTKEFVASRVYGDGALLIIPNVQPSDADIYRCVAENRYGRKSYDNFTLNITPGSVDPQYPANKDTIYTARLGNIVDLPCTHDLGDAVVEWRREFSPLPPHLRNEPILHLENVTDGDAGTYICRVRNNRVSVETHAILRVEGVNPKFDGHAWLTLPPMKDAHMEFNIEISFNPADYNGIILYSGENEDGTGDFLALQLVEGVPELLLKFDQEEPLVVRGNRPLRLNTWHIIRLSKSATAVTMDDNSEVFTVEGPGYLAVLDLNTPLYIGDAPRYRPPQLQQSPGFVGCVGMLILGKEERNILAESIQRSNVQDCDSCTPNMCLNNGVCQEARNERGYMCICALGFAGLNCDRTGDACRPDICGPGRCTDTANGYKCACPVGFTGKNCETRQNIDYPAFSGGDAYVAIKPPKMSRALRMSMKIKAKPPVTDGVIMYCAQSARGYGGFTALTVHDGRVEFRYDLGDGSGPVVLVSNKTIVPNEWTDVRIARVANMVSLKIDLINSYETKLSSGKEVYFDTPMFVGGVDDSIILNNNTGVTGGFNGCIKDVTLNSEQLNLINNSIHSANVQECVTYDRGDIPEMEGVCSQCRNGGYCLNPEATACTCPAEYTGLYCETRVSYSNRPYGDPCSASPCRNGGICKTNRAAKMNYTCDCPLGFAGANCQMQLELLQSVGFNGNGYLELPASYLRYDQLRREPALIAMAFHTTGDGVLLFQKEGQQSYPGDFMMLRVESGYVVFEWDLGSGTNTLVCQDVQVNDGERHDVIIKLYEDSHVELSVDDFHKNGLTNGFTNVMNADSNIYIGGIPDSMNKEYNLQGLVGCIEQVEFNDSRSLNLGRVAVAGRNTQRCRD